MLVTFFNNLLSLCLFVYLTLLGFLHDKSSEVLRGFPFA